MEYMRMLLNSLPVIVVLIVWAVHLEVKFARIETDIAWLKKEVPLCRQNSEEPTR